MPTRLLLRLKASKHPEVVSTATRERNPRESGVVRGTASMSKRRRSQMVDPAELSQTQVAGAAADPSAPARGTSLVMEEKMYEISGTGEREETFSMEFGPLPQAGQYSLALTLHELGAPRLCQSALAHATCSPCPCGHPHHLRSPPLAQWPLDWAQNASFRRWDADESLRWRSGARPKLPI